MRAKFQALMAQLRKGYAYFGPLDFWLVIILLSLFTLSFVAMFVAMVVASL